MCCLSSYSKPCFQPVQIQPTTVVKPISPRFFSRSPVLRCLFNGTSTNLKPLSFPQCLEGGTRSVEAQCPESHVFPCHTVPKGCYTV